MRNLIVALVATLAIAAPLAASAQIAPSYTDSSGGGGGGEAQIHGRVLAFDGGYNVQVKDEKGYVDNIQLHQGTIINPTGLTLAPGMIVSIMGYNAGNFFAANEIDTPYTFSGGGYYYGGHPWNYYGPTVGLGFYFGNAGWWHGGAFYGGPSRFVGGVRYYNNNVRINTFYHGGAYVGHNYVAPPERGGYRGPQGGQRFAGGGRGPGGPGAGGFHGGGGGGEHGHGGGHEGH